ncbi:hypothetical protein [Paenibacillus aquistagni]|uniref:hypothetical protein n=1 Tax=Paenibacillus aquistagni TaxID=1852522 RepID=UPI00197D5F14|nr:hypothetical protein [Paenibacillus aquistagni]
MWIVLGGLSLSIFTALLAITRKNKTVRTKLQTSSLLLAAFIIVTSSLTACSSNNAGKSSDSETKEVTAAESEKKVLKSQDDEAQKKADEEAKAKEEAEAKAKAEEEAKRKAEEEAKALEEAEKAKIANAMSYIVPQMTVNQQMSEVTYNYIIDHNNLFPAVTNEDKAAAKAEVDTSITSRHLFKNVTPYFDKMFSVSGYVVQVTEEETDMGTIATVHILDDNGSSIIGIYFGSTGDILDGDNVRMRGVPTASYSFQNIGGGTTNAVLLTLSTIQKL